MFDFFYKSSLKTKLLIGYLIVLVPVFVLVFMQIGASTQYKKHDNTIGKLRLVRSTVNQIQIWSLSDLKEFSNLIFSENNAELQEALVKHEEYKSHINTSLDTLKQVLRIHDWPIGVRSEVFSFRKILETIGKKRLNINGSFEDAFKIKLLVLYKSNGQWDAVSNNSSSNNTEIKNKLYQLNGIDREFYTETNAFVEIIENIRQTTHILEKQVVLDVEDIRSLFQIQFYILFLLMALLPFILARTLSKHIQKMLRGVQNRIKKLQVGSFDKFDIPETHGEYGVLVDGLNQLNNHFEVVQGFAISIKNGDYKEAKAPFNEDSELGSALQKMQDSLKHVAEDREEQQFRDKLQRWRNIGTAKFADILRQYSGDIQKLADELVMNLSDYIGANQGALFVVEETENTKYLKLTSAFAYERKKYIQKEIRFGDGLVGACAKEKKTIYMDKVPKKYMNIRSGLGGAAPTSLLLVPLKIDDELHGIIELASFSTFKKHEIEFVEALGESIASSLSAAKSNVKTTILLNETRLQADELASQEEEMRQNLEEMQATSEESERRERELNSIVVAIDNTLIKAEFSIDGDHDSVNSKYLAYFGISQEQLNNYDAESFVVEEERIEFNQMWKNVCDGAPQQGMMKRRTNSDELVWMIGSYTPILDEMGKIRKVLFMASDNTKQVRLEMDAREQSEQIKAQEAEMEKSFDVMIKAQEETERELLKVKNKNKVTHFELNLVSSLQNLVNEAWAMFDSEMKLIFANKQFGLKTGYVSISEQEEVYLSDLLSGHKLEDQINKGWFKTTLVEFTGIKKDIKMEIKEVVVETGNVFAVQIKES